MMQAQKEKQSAGDKKGGAKKTDGGVSVSLIFVELNKNNYFFRAWGTCRMREGR